MHASAVTRLGPWLVACALASAGCRHHHGVSAVEDLASEDGALVSDSADTLGASSDTASVARPFFVALDAATVADATMAAKAAESAGDDGFSPAGCAVVTSAGASATTVFHGCSGAFGLARVEGSVRADYGRDEIGRLAVRLTGGDDLRINGQSAVYQATLLVTLRDGDPAVTWNASWTATNHAGRVVHHESSIDLALDAPGSGSRCVDISGVTHGWVVDTARGLDTVIDGYRVCPGACPTAGTISSTGTLAHRTITLSFDGTDVAHVTAPRRGTFDVALSCDP